MRASWGVVLIGLGLAGAAMAAPAPADPAAVEAARGALTGAPEDVPALWGGEAMDADPGQVLGAAIKDLASPPAADDVVTAASPAPAPSRDVPPSAPSPQASDQVSAVVVQGRRNADAQATLEKCVTGPAWWRASKGGVTVWIVGVPDQLPMDTAFDDTCLKKRLAAAQEVILPAIPRSSAQDPFGRANSQLRQGPVLSQRLTPGLWAQLSRRIDDDEILAKAAADWARVSPVQIPPPDIGRRNFSNGGGEVMIRTTLQVMLDTPDLYAPPIVVASRLALSLDIGGDLGDPLASQAETLATNAGKFVGHTANTASQFSTLVSMVAPTEGAQQACLKNVLDALDAGETETGDLSRIQAWARGDYADGLMRMNVLETCSLGDLSVRFWSALVAQNMDLIARGTQRFDVITAVIELDPLLMKGGVLQRLTAAGYTVTPPEDLQ